MTIDEFLIELEKCRNKDGKPWSIKYQSYFRPRALRNGADQKYGQCPITAVAAALGKFDRIGWYQSSAEEIGLTLADADTIANAADFRGNTALTTRLLAACGVS